jgi:hypothetical protein
MVRKRTLSRTGKRQRSRLHPRRTCEEIMTKTLLYCLAKPIVHELKVEPTKKEWGRLLKVMERKLFHLELVPKSS